MTASVALVRMGQRVHPTRPVLVTRAVVQQATLGTVCETGKYVATRDL